MDKCIVAHKSQHDDFGALMGMKHMNALRCSVLGLMVHALGAEGGLLGGLGETIERRKLQGSGSDQVRPSYMETSM